MSATQKIIQAGRNLIRAFDQQIIALPGVGSLFQSRWNIIHGDPIDGFALVTADGLQDIPHRVSTKSITGRVVLRLGASIGQLRSITLPAAAAEDPTAAVQLQMDTLSPFAPNDTAFAIQSITEDMSGKQIEVQIALTSKSRMGDLLAQAKQLGLNIKAVDVTDPEDLLGDPLVDLTIGQAVRPAIGPTTILGICCALMLVASIGLHLWANRQLEPRLAQMTAQTQPINTKTARQQQLARAGRLSVMETWDAITRALPDTAWAETLSIENQQVRLAGHSTNAALLVSQLEASPALFDVRLAAASVQEEMGRESFDLVAQIRARGEAQ
ncbi:MAG: hypothetical protein COA47_09295 [Robiginitomaculum sp.]|nr:MAG: hypothetical protein COA47_09295 [Robiginitomaculum sp.]